MEVFARLDPATPLIVAEAVWQYSHHLLHGLISHRAPILTVANWSGTWPGLVGLLNLNGSMTKAGVKYSSLWSEDFTDPFFLRGLATWLQTGAVRHPTPHVHPLARCSVPARARRTGGKNRRGPPPAQSDHGRFRRRLHGHVQCDHPRRTALPVRRVQGAALPIRALPRRHPGAGDTKRGPSTSGCSTGA